MVELLIRPLSPPSLALASSRSADINTLQTSKPASPPTATASPAVEVASIRSLRRRRRRRPSSSSAVAFGCCYLRSLSLPRPHRTTEPGLDTPFISPGRTSIIPPIDDTPAIHCCPPSPVVYLSLARSLAAGIVPSQAHALRRWTAIELYFPSRRPSNQTSGRPTSKHTTQTYSIATQDDRSAC